MSTGICSCETPTFGNIKRPNCVIEQKTLAFPLIVPRFGSNGTRNVLDLSVDPLTLEDPDGAPGNYASFGEYIKDKTENAAWSPQDRYYPMPRVEGATFDRTETIYETAPSTKKYKIDGVGGVRTWMMTLWAKNAVHGMHRELKKFGCSDLDVYYIDIAGAMWGIKDSDVSSIIRGYEMTSETWDVFREYATDTTVSKLNVSFDLDNDECEENSYAITASELGYKATTLKGLIGATQNVSNPTTLTLAIVLTTSFGTATTAGTISGLLDPDIVVTSDVSGVLIHTATPLVENPDGTYLLTMDIALISGHILTIETSAAGYDVVDASITIV